MTSTTRTDLGIQSGWGWNVTDGSTWNLSEGHSWR